jgi:hypothetical protein
MNAKTAERAGTNQFQTLHMVNTKTMGHVFRHPKYYKQLKEKYEKEASSIKHQAGDNDLDPTRGVGPEAGITDKRSSSQASSAKQQA